MIKVTNVTKRFGDHAALDGLNMTVPKGSIYGLIGVNGAGKTTIIKHLGGYLIPDEGEITIDGQQVLDNEELKRRVAFIPDELFFFKRYSMKDTAKYYKSIYPTWDEARFLEMANDFELNVNANIGKFSKGMKKQAASCLAMARIGFGPLNDAR